MLANSGCSDIGLTKLIVVFSAMNVKATMTHNCLRFVMFCSDYWLGFCIELWSQNSCANWLRIRELECSQRITIIMSRKSDST